MKELTLRNYIRETKKLYEKGIDLVVDRVGVSIKNIKENKRVSNKDFYYLGLVELKYFIYICDNKDSFGMSKSICTPISIYDFCYNHLPFYPAALKDKVIKKYGDIL